MTWLATFATIAGIALFVGALILWVAGLTMPSEKLNPQDSDLGFDWIEK